MSSFTPSSLAADSYEWGSQNSGISAYIGSEDSYNFSRPPEELSHYWGAFKDSSVYFCTVCYWPRHKGLQELKETTDSSHCQYIKAQKWDSTFAHSLYRLWSVLETLSLFRSCWLHLNIFPNLCKLYCNILMYYVNVFVFIQMFIIKILLIHIKKSLNTVEMF